MNGCRWRNRCRDMALRPIIRPVAKRVLSLLVLGVLVFCPFAANAATDFGVEGMDDPELDAVRHVPDSLDGAVESVLLTVGLPHVTVIIAVVRPADDVIALTDTHRPRQPRAPPLS